jgi:hypothetical protein
MPLARQQFLVWIALCVLIGAAVTVYLSVGLNASLPRPLTLPLDDVYIHFQYARQLAVGEPLHYISGDPASSGATSLLYPTLLAFGYRIGFQADRLAWWAVLIGALSWLGSAWLMFRLVTLEQRVSTGIGLTVALAFGLSGGISWAFMSGMETGLTIFVMLLVIWDTSRNQINPALIMAAVLALLRPEGAILGVGITVLLVYRHRWRTVPLALLPITAVFVQPIINALATGSATASGLQAKSYLYNVPFNWLTLITTVLGIFVRVWRELLTGLDIDGVQYGTTLIVLLALGVLIYSGREAIKNRVNWLLLLLLPVLLGVVGMVSLLETAFWQFKRYQQPLVAILFVLAGWSLAMIKPSANSHDNQHRTGLQSPRAIRVRRMLPAVLAGLLLIISLGTTLSFVGYYGDNIHEVANVQAAMAQYVSSTLPPSARVGVHDIGVMAYLGLARTYDVVGLSTLGEAPAWRNGPGAVYEQMRVSPFRPDYFAIYPDVRGLSYFDTTDIFKDVLKTFPSTDPVRNVASAGESQIVARADWSKAVFADQPWQRSSQAAIAAMQNKQLVDTLNVANLADEVAHHYQWAPGATLPGFPTELYQMDALDCAPNSVDSTCTVIDGGRLINGSETFTVATYPGQDLLWITRVHPRDAATLQLLVDGQSVATRVIPGGLGGHWLEIATLIPGAKITAAHTRLRVDVTTTDGHYMPYYHWFYQGQYASSNSAAPLATIDQPAHFANGANLLNWQFHWDFTAHTWKIAVTWQADPQGAAGADKVFVHVLDAAGKLVGQADQYPANNTLPPGDWLPNSFQDSYSVAVPAGSVYQLMIGLYDPLTNARIAVSGGDTAQRLLLGTVTTDF